MHILSIIKLAAEPKNQEQHFYYRPMPIFLFYNHQIDNLRTNRSQKVKKPFSKLFTPIKSHPKNELLRQSQPSKN